MVIYNVTVKTEQAIAADWLQWLKTEHIPEIIATGYFTHAHVLRLLDIDDSEGPTYAVQYFAADKRAYDQYLKEFADIMREKTFQKWGNKFIAFRSLMEVVN